MKLSEQERLSLWSHFRILANAEDDPTWWAFAEILRRGLEGEYYRLTEAFSKELSEERCGEVRAILYMYGRLQRDYRKLEEPVSVEAARLRFPGFDPRLESGCLSYVSFIREGLREHGELAVEGPALASERPMLPKYRAMLEAFEDGRRPLAAGEIDEVLAAVPDVGG